MDILINNKYLKINKIGEGSFGSIYKCQNTRTKELVAIKVEPIKNDTKLLKNESIIYQYLNNCLGIPTVKWFGKDNTNYYMVINLLGESLQNLIEKKNTFSLKLTLQIGIKIIMLLKTIHDKGLVHRDVKPDNFLFGLNNDKKNIYIIDFGFCKSYLNGETHIELKKTKNLIGSLNYASMNSHDYLELSRRDDLESLGYMLLYFYLGKLKWQNMSILEYNENLNELIKQMKKNIYSDDIPEVFIIYFKYVRCIEFSEKPNYFIIIDNFKREIENISSKI
jgi:serine/threonine protein kinase